MEQYHHTSLHLRDIISIFFKRKKLIFFIWFFCVAVISVYAILTKPIYEASARLMIKVGRENLYISPLRSAGDSTPVVDSHLEEQMNSEVEILKSRLLIEKVLLTILPATLYPADDGLLARFHSQQPSANSIVEKAHNNALRSLEKNLKVEGIKKTNVIKISFRHTNPELSAKVLNTLVNLYLEQHLEIHQASLSSGFLQGQGQKLQGNLKQAETALNRFKEKHHIDSSPEEQKKLLLAKESEMQAELIKTENLEQEAQARISHYKSRSVATPAYINVHEIVLKSEAELKEAHVKKPLLLKQLYEYRRELQRLNDVEDEFLNLHQQVEMYRHNLGIHNTKIHEESYQAALDKDKVSNVSVIDPAWPPLDSVTPKGLFIILAFLLGGIAAIGTALFLEYIDDHIENAQDVEKCLPGLPLLTSIPYMKDDPQGIKS